MQRSFTPEKLAANPPSVARTRRVLLSTDPAGYAGCCAAIRDMDQTSLLCAIHAPTMIVVGDRDVSTPWQGHGDVLAGGIPHARVERLPTAHLSNLERPRSFTAALARFLMARPADALAAGFEKRRAILGGAPVESAPAARAAKKMKGDTAANAVRENVLMIVEKLETDPRLAAMVKSGEVRIVGGVYDLHSGTVKLITDSASAH